MAINVMVFSGNCGADMELKYLPSGTAIGTVNVPCKSGWGEKEKASWITCKVFGERAEKLAPHITKGSLVTISGRFELEQWEKDGVKHSRPVCIVDDIQLAPKASQQPQQSQGAADYRSASGGRQSGGNGGDGFGGFDDDIPFAPYGREILV